jgi:hypothetical protein
MPASLQSASNCFDDIQTERASPQGLASRRTSRRAFIPAAHSNGVIGVGVINNPHRFELTDCSVMCQRLALVAARSIDCTRSALPEVERRIFWHGKWATMFPYFVVTTMLSDFSVSIMLMSTS